MPSRRSSRSSTAAAAAATEALRFAEVLARSCSEALGDTVTGVILHGSVTLDDYLPGRSDVDLLVIGQDPLSDARLAALTEVLAGHRPRAPGPVDLRVVTRRVAASPTPAPPLEAYLRLTPPSGCGWRSAGTPGSATWRWSSRCAARTAGACWARPRPS